MTDNKSRCKVIIRTQREDFTTHELGSVLSTSQRYQRMLSDNQSIEIYHEIAGVSILVPVSKIDYVLIKEEEQHEDKNN